MQKYLVFKIHRQFKVYTAMFQTESEALQYISRRTGKYEVQVMEVQLEKEAA